LACGSAAFGIDELWAALSDRPGFDDYLTVIGQ
jgi:hypothetical protein